MTPPLMQDNECVGILGTFENSKRLSDKKQGGKSYDFQSQ